MTDLEIANKCTLQPIEKIADKLGLSKDSVELYGKYKAKIDIPNPTKKGKLILVTAINPTAAGEGKTTVSIGLADGMNLRGKQTCLALREPSLGPVFGVKGGATGGGYSQVLPMEDINLHFTGDFHAITTANNLLCAAIDNSIFQGNPLNIDPNKITFNRTMDMNDRALRGIVVNHNVPKTEERTEKFNITAACEVMAIMTLANDMEDLKIRLGNILVGYTYDNKPVYARDLNAQGAMAILLKDALKPNLVQTIGGTPAIIHCGPFANIAHGCNSIRATRIALGCTDYVVTEAGFGADLGAEKFLDVKARVSGLVPDAVVMVATCRALKLHGGANKEDLKTEDMEALKKGIGNLLRHVNNIINVYHLPCVVAINQFITDTEQELNYVKETVQKETGVESIISNVWGKGGEGALELADAVVKKCEEKTNFTFSYPSDESLKEKIYDVATKIYGAKDVVYTETAEKNLVALEKLGCGKMPVVIAKTQYSFSDDPTKLGAPEGFTLTIRDVEPRMGAGFVVAIAGNMLLMPGLSKTPAYMRMDIKDGVIEGLF